MNKTFKVVFNRARAGLMVANEITSSVQKKGTKTVVAAAALGLMAMFAQANPTEYADEIWNGSSETLASSYTGDFETGNEKNWIAALCAEEGASGDLSNLTIEKTGDRTQQLFGLAVYDNANFNLTGESVTVNLSTGGLGGGEITLSPESIRKFVRAMIRGQRSGFRQKMFPLRQRQPTPTERVFTVLLLTEGK